MWKLLDLKTRSYQILFNRRQFSRNHNYVSVKCVDRLHVTVNCQASDQTPRTVLVEYADQDREVTTSAARYRLKNFRGRHDNRSRIPAAPMPPPTHIVTIPYRPLRRSNSRRMLAVSFAPVQPSGWPRAIAPPLTLTFSGSSPNVLITASDCAANASFNSITSMSASVSPASFKTFGIANTGPIPISSGGQPAVAYATKRAIGLAPNARARESDMTIAAAAPSDICDALPAVIVPFM